MIQEELEKLADDFASESDRAGTVFHIGLMRGFIAGYRKGQCNPEIKKLEWSEPAPPDGNYWYDHVTAESPFGTYSIQWKSWKEWGDDKTIFLDEDYVMLGGFDLEEAKNLAQEHFNKKAMGCIETNDNSKNH